MKTKNEISGIAEAKKFVSPCWQITYTGKINGKEFSFSNGFQGAIHASEATYNTLTEKEVRAASAKVLRFRAK